MTKRQVTLLQLPTASGTCKALQGFGRFCKDCCNTPCTCDPAAYSSALLAAAAAPAASALSISGQHVPKQDQLWCAMNCSSPLTAACRPALPGPAAGSVKTACRSCWCCRASCADARPAFSSAQTSSLHYGMQPSSGHCWGSKKAVLSTTGQSY